jgi:predicted transcriptional regulator
MTETTISAQIPEKLGNELDALAGATKRPKAQLVTEALEDYVSRQARRLKQIDEAIKEADEVGDFASEEDTAVWLRSWGSGAPQPPPQLRKRGA